MSRPIVTASMLEDLARAGREIVLDRNALITPAAQDWLRHRNYPVVWRDAGEDSSAAMGLVANLSTPMVRSIYAALQRSVALGEPIEIGGDLASVICGVRRLCEAIAAGRWQRGVVLTDEAAAAVCGANKHAGIRAALANQLSAVHQAVHAIGANVLVIEPSVGTYHQIRQVVQWFARASVAASQAVAEAIATLEAASSDKTKGSTDGPRGGSETRAHG